MLAGAAQVLLGAFVALNKSERRSLVVAGANGVVILGWMATRGLGMTWLGVEAAEPPAFVDTAAATVALVAFGTGLSVARRPALQRVASAAPALLLAALALPLTALAARDAGHENSSHENSGHGHGHAPTPNVSVPPVVVTYDPTHVAADGSHVDLEGLPGVSNEQAAWGEELVEHTLEHLPQWADVNVALAAGFQAPTSDDLSGYEHYTRLSDAVDGESFDPDRPESLVYQPQPDGSRRLVAAMYMIAYDRPVAEIETPGGPLIRFHEHFGRLATYVWIVPNECGPFAPIPARSGGVPIPGRGPCER